MFRSVSRFATLVIAAAASFAVATVHAVRVTAAYLRDWAFLGLENLHQTPAGEISSLPTVRRVRAHAFVARLLKRERPHVTSGWRMCPST
jgi:hypothetical protein